MGWWLVVVFCLLALGHLLQSSPTFSGQIRPSGAVSVVEVIVPLLLLIGMAHTESVFVQQVRLEAKQRALMAELEGKAQEEIATLRRERDALLKELARIQQEHKSLQDSARDFRLLFASIPQVLFVFDLRSFRILAVNSAAIAQYGFSSEQFLARSVCDILPGEDVGDFVRDAARPATGAQPRGRWRHRKKDGTVLEVEVLAVDLRFGGCPARLMLASQVTVEQLDSR